MKFNEIAGSKIVVVGDFILDMYRIMSAERLSPEADVLIFKPETTEYRAGGAANVAQNLMALGATPTLVTVLGMNNLIESHKCAKFKTVFIDSPKRKTTLKERLVTRRQQIARIDDQTKIPIDDNTSFEVSKKAREALEDAKALVLSDYDHGVMVQNVVVPLIARARELNIPVIVDSKAKDTLSKYRGATIALPNNVEAKAFTTLYDFDEDAIAKFILKNMCLDALGLTLGPKGIMLVTKETPPTIYPPLEDDVKSEVKDVTGAGDTVTSAVAAALAVGATFAEAIKFSNIAAGIVVRKLGVATASMEEIKQAIIAHNLEI